jgi:hypothetical protein
MKKRSTRTATRGKAKANVKELLRSLEGRNVHLENLDGDAYNGLLEIRPDGLTVGTNPFAIDFDNVKSVRET